MFRGSAPARIVTVYGRAGCPLCAEAVALVCRWAPALGYAVEEVDIESDPLLLARYDAVVPVVAVGGREAGRAPLDPVALRARLEALLAEG